MLRTFTCIMCPRGCDLEAELEPITCQAETPESRSQSELVVQAENPESRSQSEPVGQAETPESRSQAHGGQQGGSLERGEFSIRQITGNACPKGEQYVRQEIENPMRNIATSILVDGGDLPLASVRLSGPVPKGRIFDVMKEIRQVRKAAPVTQGQVVIPDVLGLGVDVIVTKTVDHAN